MSDYAYGYGPADAEPEKDDIETASSLRENSGSGLVNTRIADRESEVSTIYFNPLTHFIHVHDTISIRQSVIRE